MNCIAWLTDHIDALGHMYDGKRMHYYAVYKGLSIPVPKVLFDAINSEQLDRLDLDQATKDFLKGGIR